MPIATVSTRAALRSAARGDLVVPRTRRRLGNRAFCVAGPTAWNSLPLDIRTASYVTTFKNLLKTHLFIQSYITQHNSECPMLYGALVVTLWTCYGALSYYYYYLLLWLSLKRRISGAAVFTILKTAIITPFSYFPAKPKT